MRIDSHYIAFCAQLRQKKLLRQLPKTRNYQHDFSSNDYLGLSSHPEILQAATTLATQYGMGSRASRLILPLQHSARALECTIAQTKKTENALIFATGFQTNISVLSALLDSTVLGSSALVFSDRLNHASMHVACQMATVKQLRYRHVDYDHLAFQLKQYQSSRQPKFILSESVFGMDGDIADLAKLISLAKDHHALLYVDEAHATGLFGKQGYGLSEFFEGEIDVVMGTFSKALGTSGGYVACSHSLARYFINRCQGFIYSTAPSPMQIGAMQKAWELIPSVQPQAKQLLITAARLKEQLAALGFNTGNSTSHIIPIILGDAQSTLAAQKFLAKRDVRVSAIRAPSVPPNQCRLRIALTTAHSDAAINALCEGLKEWKKSLSAVQHYSTFRSEKAEGFN